MFSQQWQFFSSQKSGRSEGIPLDITEQHIISLNEFSSSSIFLWLCCSPPFEGVKKIVKQQEKYDVNETMAKIDYTSGVASKRVSFPDQRFSLISYEALQLGIAFQHRLHNNRYQFLVFIVKGGKLIFYNEWDEHNVLHTVRCVLMMPL